jgi:hypothetical protein
MVIPSHMTGVPGWRGQEVQEVYPYCRSMDTTSVSALFYKPKAGHSRYSRIFGGDFSLYIFSSSFSLYFSLSSISKRERKYLLYLLWYQVKRKLYAGLRASRFRPGSRVGIVGLPHPTYYQNPEDLQVASLHYMPNTQFTWLPDTLGGFGKSRVSQRHIVSQGDVVARREMPWPPGKPRVSQRDIVPQGNVVIPQECRGSQKNTGSRRGMPGLAVPELAMVWVVV